MGLRELKKTRTRQHIADTAWRLFAERGFDHVSVAEIAAEAEVSVATVFNHFRTKEDVFYFRLDTFEARLIERVRTRPAGEAVLVAVRRHLLQPGGLVAQAAGGDGHALALLRTVNGVIAASPTLLAREHQALAQAADALADLILTEAGESADRIEASVTAHTLMAVHRVLIDYVRQRVLADDTLESLAADVQRLGGHAFALLERGLAGYAPKPEAPSGD